MAEGPAHQFHVFHHKLSTFFAEVAAEHFSWLRGMEEAAREMFLSPELEPNADCDKAPKHLRKTFIIPNEGSPVAGQSAQSEPPNGTEQQAGNCKESHLKKSGTSQSKEQPQNAKSLEPPSSIRTPRYKETVLERCNGQQLEDCDHSPSYDKATSSPVSKTLASLSPASKVARPFKRILRTVQKNQLLLTPGSTGHNSVMKNHIKRNTPTRPDSKSFLVMVFSSCEL